MREIKFRAWNGKEYLKPEYVDFTEFAIEPDGSIFCMDEMGGWEGGRIYRSLHSYVIEQFTALKDKNGKEIYEGDIVKYELQDVYINYYTVMFGEPNNHDWGGASFYLRRISNERYSDSDVYPGIEVIGNIHENPELLQVK